MLIPACQHLQLKDAHKREAVTPQCRMHHNLRVSMPAKAHAAGPWKNRDAPSKPLQYPNLKAWNPFT